MIIFIDDRPIRISNLSNKSDFPLKEDYDLIVDARLKPIKIKELKGHICLLNVTLDQMAKIIEDLHEYKLDFQSLYILVDDKKLFKQKIISLYSLVEASGGLVRNEENKLLWIYRLGKWDLPKGKLEKNETFKFAAKREIEEECNVQAFIEFKLCTTYHTYTHRNQRVLKRTKWYMMHTIQKHKLIPQKEEGIEKVEWLSQFEMKKVALANTYSSIRYVMERFSSLQIPFKS
jgi:8-oxo-dGTP pyrophosphatase MutT (NUDIX family)